MTSIHLSKLTSLITFSFIFSLLFDYFYYSLGSLLTLLLLGLFLYFSIRIISDGEKWSFHLFDPLSKFIQCFKSNTSRDLIFAFIFGGLAGAWLYLKIYTLGLFGFFVAFIAGTLIFFTTLILFSEK
jgi:hypothetical protein